MLFLLNYQREIESNIDNLAPEQIQGGAEMGDLEDQPIYQGPQTGSRTKALMKANLIMTNVHDPGSCNCAIFVLYTIPIVLSSTSRV